MSWNYKCMKTINILFHNYNFVSFNNLKKIYLFVNKLSKTKNQNIN